MENFSRNAKSFCLSLQKLVVQKYSQFVEPSFIVIKYGKVQLTLTKTSSFSTLLID